MSEASGSRSKRTIVVGGVSLAVVLACGYLAAGMLFDNSVESNLVSGHPQRMVDTLAQFDNEQFTSDENTDLRNRTLQAMKETPLEEVLDRIRSPELSDQDRDNLEANLKDLMMEDMNNKIDEYTEAPEEQKEEILDRHIDEMQDFWAEMKAYHEKHKDDADYQAEREKRQAAHKRPSKQDRKNWMEGSSPDRMVRMFKYWGKMKERATARGIDFGGGKRE